MTRQKVKVQTLADLTCSCSDVPSGVTSGCFRCTSIANYYKLKLQPARPIVGVFFQIMPRGFKQ